MKPAGTDRLPSVPDRPARRVLVLILPHVHMLDMSGPVQTFAEANAFGARYELTYVAAAPRIVSDEGLALSDLTPLPPVRRSDLVLVPGVQSATLDRLDVPVRWLRGAHAAGATICAVCSGAFALGRAGLLDGRSCTTHWKVTRLLEERFPKADVAEGRLFVRDGNVVTSAGVTSGIDMALALVEEDHGPLVAAKVAREMVVYIRRSGDRDQSSVYLDFRAHIDPGVHRVQDAIVAHPERRYTLEELAAEAAMSPRTLTRAFREATGITVGAFIEKVRLQMARDLMRNPEYTLEGVSARLGFADARQLRRLFWRNLGQSPSEWREESLRAPAP